MKVVNTHEAKTHLSALLAEVAQGGEVTIARNGNPIARLVPIPPSTPRKPGRFSGQIEFHEDILKPEDPEDLLAWEQGHSGDPLRNPKDPE